MFDVTELEPSIYMTAAGLLTAVVIVASLAPAFAAMRVNPVEALKLD